MPLLKYFSEEEREKRRRRKEEQKRERMMSQVSKLSNPAEELPLADHIMTAARLEKTCGWPPEKETFWLYVYALGFQAIGYLDLARNVHLRVCYEFYHELAWKWAAWMAANLAQRAILGLGKLPSPRAAYIEGAIGSLENILRHALDAEKVSLADAIELSTYSERRVGSGGGYVLHPVLRGAYDPEQGLVRRIEASDVPGYLRDDRIGGWLTRNLDTLETPDILAETLPFEGIRVMYEHDSSNRPVLHSTSGLKVFGRTVSGEHVGLGTFHGFIHIEGELPVVKEHALSLDTEKVSDLLLLTGHGQYATDLTDCIRLAALKIADIRASGRRAEVKLIIRIDTNGRLTLSAINESEHSELEVCRII